MTGRQRYTGLTLNTFIWWGIGVVLLWGLPTLMAWWWPTMVVSTKEPWLLDSADLTWSRGLMNMMTKPGFRVLWVGLWTAGWVGVSYFLMTRVRGKGWRRRLAGFDYRSSAEWAIDGTRRHALGEYGMWVGVV